MAAASSIHRGLAAATFFSLSLGCTYPRILDQLAEQYFIQMFKPDDDRWVAIVVRVIHVELGRTDGDQGIFFS
jgi:hypothetical protein